MVSKNLSQLALRHHAPVIVIDTYGVITFVNAKFEFTYAWSSSQLLGKPLTTIIPPVLHDAHNMGFSHFLSTEQSTLLEKPLTLSIIKGDGSICLATHTIFGEKKEGQWIFLATIEPI